MDHCENLSSDLSIVLSDDNQDITTDPQAKRFKYNYATIESINNDCLRDIFKYLDLFEAVNLATTCTRFFDFANSDIFPLKAKKINIYMNARIVRISSYTWNFDFDDEEYYEGDNEYYDYEDNAYVPNNIFTWMPIFLFDCFGAHVQHLTLQTTEAEEGFSGYSFSMVMTNGIDTGCLLNFAEVLKLCPNLNSLSIKNVRFPKDAIQTLKSLTSRLDHLELIRCFGITNDWSEALKGNAKLNKLTLIGSNYTSEKFFTNFNSLSELTIGHQSCSSAKSFEVICDLNGHSLEHIKLAHFSKSDNFQTITSLIVDKLPKLKTLAVVEYFTDKLTAMIDELPHLNSLKIFCSDRNVNSLMRKLSDHGNIEYLEFQSGIFNCEKMAQPLIFKKLKSFRWIKKYKFESFKNCSGMLIAITESHMPEICNLYFGLDLVLENHANELLNLFESKTTLKTLGIMCTRHEFEPSTLFRKIISILKMQNREFLTLTLSYLYCDNEVSNNHDELKNLYLILIQFLSLFIYFT